MANWALGLYVFNVIFVCILLYVFIELVSTVCSTDIKNEWGYVCACGWSMNSALSL